MSLPYRRQIQGQALPLLENDIDTDRIIPARFMKCVTFEGIGAYAFYDVRFSEQGQPKPHVLNEPRYKKSSILVTGKNFGCGSSREHAPQALLRYGLEAIVGESFAEIFAGNCTVLGIPCVTLPSEALKELAILIEAQPEMPVQIDLESLTLSGFGQSWPISIKETYRKSLVSGTWDSTAELLKNQPLIEQRAQNLPYLSGF